MNDVSKPPFHSNRSSDAKLARAGARLERLNAAAPMLLAETPYPPSPLRTAALRLIADQGAHEWSAEDALQELSPASAQAARCCLVRVLPHQPVERGAPGNELTYGQQSEGYVIVKPRRCSAEWPTLSTGEPRPIKLHRWLVGAQEGEIVMHSCDEPTCVRRAHLSRGSASANLADAHRRGRRRQARSRLSPSSASAARAASKQQLAVIASNHLSAAQARREGEFITGFASPTKRARAAARAAQEAAAQTPIAIGLQ